jgi:hypothetical protein
VAGVFLIAACGGLLYFGFQQVSGEGEVAVEVDRLFEDIAQGNAAEYYRSRSSNELKSAASEQEFVGLCQTIDERLGKLRSKTVSGFNVRNHNLTNYVDAVYTCQFERGKASVKSGFKHQNGQWLLQSFHIDSPELIKATVRKKCPNCGKLYEPTSKFCRHCGKELPQATILNSPSAALAVSAMPGYRVETFLK